MLREVIKPNPQVLIFNRNLQVLFEASFLYLRSAPSSVIRSQWDFSIGCRRLSGAVDCPQTRLSATFSPARRSADISQTTQPVDEGVGH